MWDIQEGRMNIDIIREQIKNNINRNVKIKVNGLRNKTNIYYGKIINVYPYIFSVMVDEENKSFSYADVITGEVEVSYL
jgi:uncharacterized protein Veg